MTTIAVSLPSEVDQRLGEVAAKSGRTKSECVREAIFQFIEDVEDLQIASERLAVPGRRLTMEEAERELELDR